MTSVQIIGVQYSAFTRAVQFCCEEIGLTYKLGTQINGQEFGMRTAALKTLNPFAKIPVVIEQGKTLYESQAICRYLDNQYN